MAFSVLEGDPLTQEVVANVPPTVVTVAVLDRREGAAEDPPAAFADVFGFVRERQVFVGVLEEFRLWRLQVCAF